MTGKADFSGDEWARLKRAPFIAGMAISLADPGGPIELVKETAATLKTVREAAESGGRGELVDRHAEQVLQAQDLPQALDVGLGVGAVAPRAAVRRGEQADLFVVAMVRVVVPTSRATSPIRITSRRDAPVAAGRPRRPPATWWCCSGSTR